jgi:hypothetical protein
MVVAPLVLSTLVFGIASMGDATAIGEKWFLKLCCPAFASTCGRVHSWRKVFAFSGCRPDKPARQPF